MSRFYFCEEHLENLVYWHLQLQKHARVYTVIATPQQKTGCYVIPSKEIDASLSCFDRM